MNNLSFSANSVARVEQIQRNKSVMAPKMLARHTKTLGVRRTKVCVFADFFFLTCERILPKRWDSSSSMDLG